MSEEKEETETGQDNSAKNTLNYVTNYHALTVLWVILICSLVVFELMILMAWAKVEPKVIETTVMQIVSAAMGALTATIGHFAGKNSKDGSQGK